ncbi:3-beta hydroxysteroid dehydrogenase/isomerase family protein [Rhizoctonia solani 123E]|uniref:3-beta hydroxysteroid dehydrogenase/isomerase family protein n=1 Tax=Rhizoctonia solani 123E TaxID=1423351 RepID=A0A074RJV2_9AGAM|nr:3-beta hydroxysteroid dehydrogenase/isomerase family protein [Rhizoctonia solani 123E]
MSTVTKLPLVAVCGATGAQGSSVARYLLQDGGYKVRVLTRNPDGEKAQALKQQGAEIVRCDLGSEEQVTAALSGAYAVFGLTNFWEAGAETEVKQGKNLADAAKTCRIKHFFWSSCPHVDGEAPRHWESKCKVESYLRELGVPTTTIFPSFYYENIWMFFPLKQNSDSSLMLDWFFPSDVRIPSFSVKDLGAWFVIALKNPETWIGKQMKLCSEILTPRDYAAKLGTGLETNVIFKEVTLPEFEALRPHIPDDIWLNIKAFWDNPNLMDEGLALSMQLFPGVRNLEEFAKENKDRLLASATSA